MLAFSKLFLTLTGYKDYNQPPVSQNGKIGSAKANFWKIWEKAIFLVFETIAVRELSQKSRSNAIYQLLQSLKISLQTSVMNVSTASVLFVYYYYHISGKQSSAKQLQFVSFQPYFTSGCEQIIHLKLNSPRSCAKKSPEPTQVWWPVCAI